MPQPGSSLIESCFVLLRFCKPLGESDSESEISMFLHVSWLPMNWSNWTTPHWSLSSFCCTLTPESSTWCPGSQMDIKWTGQLRHVKAAHACNAFSASLDSNISYPNVALWASCTCLRLFQVASLFQLSESRRGKGVCLGVFFRSISQVSQANSGQRLTFVIASCWPLAVKNSKARQTNQEFGSHLHLLQAQQLSKLRTSWYLSNSGRVFPCRSSNLFWSCASMPELDFICWPS